MFFLDLKLDPLLVRDDQCPVAVELQLVDPLVALGEPLHDLRGHRRTADEQQRVYQTDAYGRIQHSKPSYSVGEDGRIVEVDPYGNKQHDKPQYVIRKDRVYETAYGRIQYHKPS